MFDDDNVLKNLKIVLRKLTTRILITFEVSGVAGIALCTLLFTFVVEIISVVYIVVFLC